MPRQPTPMPTACATVLLAALAAAACRTPAPEGGAAPDTAAPPSRPAAAAPSAGVVPGLEVLLRDSMHLVRGRRVGLITNQTALTRDGTHAVDALARAEGVNLVALFGPEHGVRGNIEGGLKIDTQRDSATGLPVYSLYGQTQRPTPEMLRGIDVLLFDIQDIGARPYTFVWTMAMAMEAAAAQGIPFVVLDRPNPITARVDGPMMQPEIKRDRVGQAITGYYPVPLRHGMTAGEIARYVNGEFGVGARLHVVPVEGWTGDTWWDETGLRWVNPSPNIRSPEAALTYAGLVLSEATNLTVGRGTDAPFRYLGAPWLDAPAVLERVRGYGLPGVRIDTASFVPASPDPNAWVPFRGERVRALSLTVTDRDAFDAGWTALVLMSEIRRRHPDEFRITNDGFTQMIGSRWARAAFERGDDPREIAARWREELRTQWEPVAAKYRIYPRD